MRTFGFFPHFVPFCKTCLVFIKCAPFFPYLALCTSWTILFVNSRYTAHTRASNRYTRSFYIYNMQCEFAASELQGSILLSARCLCWKRIDPATDWTMSMFISIDNCIIVAVCLMKCSMCPWFRFETLKGVLFKHFAYDLGVHCLVLLTKNSLQFEADVNGQTVTSAKRLGM